MARIKNDNVVFPIEICVETINRILGPYHHNSLLTGYDPRVKLWRQVFTYIAVKYYAYKLTSIAEYLSIGSHSTIGAYLRSAKEKYDDPTIVVASYNFKELTEEIHKHIQNQIGVTGIFKQNEDLNEAEFLRSQLMTCDAKSFTIRDIYEIIVGRFNQEPSREFRDRMKIIYDRSVQKSDNKLPESGVKITKTGG